MNKKKKWLTFLLAAGILLWLSFIFGNSMQNMAASGERSRRIVYWIWPEALTMPESVVPYNRIIRALAHFTEFFILGLLLFLVMRKKKWGIRKTILLCAGIALADEILQSFTGRHCDLRDAGIDTLGASAGVILESLLWKLFGNREKGSNSK